MGAAKDLKKKVCTVNSSLPQLNLYSQNFTVRFLNKM